MKLFFDVLHLYYLPQYLPVYRELIKQKAGNATFIFYRGQHDEIINKIIQDEALDHVWVSSNEQAISYYAKHPADWVFFANGCEQIERVHKTSKTVQLGHGIGPKSCFYSQSNNPTTVRFVEGDYRTKRLQQMFPQGNFVNVGYSKLDPLLNNEQVALNLAELGLNPNNKTLLYAPTFYPSSIERFPEDWPLQFAQYNILIKPHYFSLSKSRYKKQRVLLELWQSYNNVYLAQIDDYSLIPFMATADLLISDASSALFEFAALDKPVVWCDFLKLRWSYRGPLAFRFKKRMDQDYGEYSEIAVHAKQYQQVKAIVDEQLANPGLLSNVRRHYAQKLAGALDGQASKRIISYLKQYDN